MTRLRQMMLDELERRNYSQTTRRAYLLGVEQFAKHFHRSPDKLKLTDIRDYQAYLFRARKLQPATVTVRLAALRFLFVAVLKRPWTTAETPYPKRPDKLPIVLSQDEVARLTTNPLTRERAARRKRVIPSKTCTRNDGNGFVLDQANAGHPP